ncbi:WASH complex subunit 3-like [Oppia nitens]|uniref:WASH complex subunit 3-like n=1 Tax=Oppia nitens TaxID=1686743 RepID=UPI0023DAC7B0|nr:WASH complex subunit 3-like [Oppia nitens]
MSSDIKELSHKQISLDKLKPLKSNRLVTFVNHFIVSIVQNLNELSATVDSRLYDLNQQILRCNTNLTILELKLNSIAGLSSASTNTVSASSDSSDQTTDRPLPQITPTYQTNDSQEVVTNSLITNETQESDTNGQQSNDGMDSNESHQESQEEEEVVDSRLDKYKKMVRLGIPVQAVQQKMLIDGIDPQLIKS